MYKDPVSHTLPLPHPDTTREILLYKTANGDVRVEILLHNENLWLTQAKMAELFDVHRSVVSRHLKNIFATGELDEQTTCAFFAHMGQNDTRTYTTAYYNLDAIIAVGYRINSKKATMFRIWATNTLKEYLIKGFVMNDERLKDPDNYFGKDYFAEQLERIRDIRASERRFYQKITDIYAQCSADYDPASPLTKQFFATIQNKLHYAVSRLTAPEIIRTRANAQKPNMGLTTWKNAPNGKIRPHDIIIAKNYLTSEELTNLNAIVTMYLDYAERQAKRGNIMYMKDWIERLNAFLQFNEEDILEGNGTVSREIATACARQEYEQYQKKEDARYISDFDRLLLQTGIDPENTSETINQKRSHQDTGNP